MTVATAHGIVVVSTFTPKTDRADDLLQLLTENRTDVLMRQPGFVSSELLRTGDNRLVHIARWADTAALDAMRADTAASRAMAAQRALTEAVQVVVAGPADTSAAGA